MRVKRHLEGSCSFLSTVRTVLVGLFSVSPAAASAHALTTHAPCMRDPGGAPQWHRRMRTGAAERRARPLPVVAVRVEHAVETSAPLLRGRGLVGARDLACHRHRVAARKASDRSMSPYPATAVS